MLRRFLFLNPTAVQQYASMLDGGLGDTTVATNSVQRSTGGGVDARVVSAKHERGRHDEASRTIRDTDEARFDRIVQAGEADPKRVGWIDVMDPATDLGGVGIGALVSWECDIWVPTISQALAKGSEFSSLVGMVQGILPFAEQLNLDTKDVPDAGTLDAVSQFTKNAQARLVVVGDDEDTEWKITGTLDPEHVDGDLDGRAIVVGKVLKIVKKGRWQPLLALPGLNFGSRDERRKREQQRPSPGQEENYVAGPALVLDLLAIYV